VRRERKSLLGPYVAVPKSIMQSAAWKQMSPYARLVWIELRGRLSAGWKNNGHVYAPCRLFGDAIGINKNTVYRALVELEHYGFLRKTGEGFLGSDGHGIAARYRFTDLFYNTQHATRDYSKWDGELFVYQPRKERRSPAAPHAPPMMAASLAHGHGNLDMSAQTGQVLAHSMSAQTGHTGVSEGSPSMSAQTGQSVCSDGTGFCFLQGGVTASTPVGGAGSSPAPVADIPTDEEGWQDWPATTDAELEIIGRLSPEVRMRRWD